MRSSVIVLAAVVGVAVAQSSSVCTDFDKAKKCVLKQADLEQSCQTVLAMKACYDDYCPEVGIPKELNSIIDTCENGGTFPGSGSGSGSGSGTGSESGTPTGSGSESTSTSGSGSGSDSDVCTDVQAYSDCIKPLAKLKETCDVVMQAAECFDKYCPQRVFQIEKDVAVCKASGSGSSTGSGSGSTATSSSDDSEGTGISGGGSGTSTSSSADSTGTGIDSGSDSSSTSTDPTNTSSNGDSPVSTDTTANEGAADRLFAPVGAVIGSIIAVMAWL